MDEDLANRLGFNVSESSFFKHPSYQGSIQVSHTFFDASRTYAQDHDPSPTDSLASYVFASDSPLFDGLDGTTEQNAQEVVGSAKNARWKAKALGRSFSGWTGAALENVALKWWGFERDTIGPDGMVTGGKYHQVVDYLAGLVTKDTAKGDVKLGETVECVEWNSDEGR